MTLTWANAKDYVVSGVLGLWFLAMTKDAIESPGRDEIKELLRQNTVVAISKEEILDFVNRYSQFNEVKMKIEAKIFEIDSTLKALDKRQNELFIQIQDNRTERINEIEEAKQDIRQINKELHEVTNELTRLIATIESLRDGKRR